ncbi:MAG: hypothetical protein M1817_003888 [Caeruleum heppii]|nr:MAG: hypothetical protein M1817_003888 [Caeruleum heppii]
MESPSPDTDIAGKNHTDGNSSEGKYRDFSIDSDLEAVQKLSRACHIICLTEPYDYEQGRDMIRSLVDVCDELLIRGEMFETLESKSKLFAGIYKDVTKMLEAISLSEEICVEVRALSRRQWKDHYHLTRPPFRAKLKPWNQFLSRNAPGSGTGVYCSDSKTLVQVLPPAAVQLLNAWQQDNHRLRGEMEQFMLGMPAGAGRNAATHFQRENLELAYSAKPSVHQGMSMRNGD